MNRFGGRLLGVCLIALAIAHVASSSGTQRSLALTPPEGFATGSGPPPRTGLWAAVGLTTSSIGYGNDTAGARITRTWLITRRACTPACSYYDLTRYIVGSAGIPNAIGTTLVQTPSGWRATWPIQRLICQGTLSDPIYWSQQEVWLLRFTHRGTRAEARANRFSYAPACGYGRASTTWRANFGNTLPSH